MSSEIFPTVNPAPTVEVQQIAEHDTLLGEPIPDPDDDLPTEEELPPATDHILSTQPINWLAAVEVEVVAPTEADTTYAALLALRDLLMAFGVWDARDQLELDKLSKGGALDVWRTSRGAADRLHDWSARAVGQLDLQLGSEE